MIFIEDLSLLSENGYEEGNVLGRDIMASEQEGIAMTSTVRGREEASTKSALLMKWLWKLPKEKKKPWCSYLAAKCLSNGKNGLTNPPLKYPA